jgi:hypothetical protein
MAAHTVCLAQRLGATCLSGGHGPGPTTSASKQPWERVCAQCKDGFAVRLHSIRRVPSDELLKLRPKGGSAAGFRDAPASYEKRFQYCLINDSSDLSRAAKRKHKDVSHGDALVLLLSGSPPLSWEIPKATDFGQPEDGTLKLSVKYKTFVPLDLHTNVVAPSGGGSAGGSAGSAGGASVSGGGGGTGGDGGDGGGGIALPSATPWNLVEVEDGTFSFPILHHRLNLPNWYTDPRICDRYDDEARNMALYQYAVQQCSSDYTAKGLLLEVEEWYQQALKLDGLVHACGGDIHKAGQVAILAVAEQALSELNPVPAPQS